MIKIIDLQTRAKYFVENGEKLNLGSNSKPLFIDSKFNIDNWNGGDAVIRQFCEYLKNNYFKELAVFGNNEQKLVCKIDQVEDQTYVSIVYIATCLFDSRDEELATGMQTLVSQYNLEWYKNRGRIEVFTNDLDPINELEYLILLNRIEKTTGFKFNFNY